MNFNFNNLVPVELPTVEHKQKGKKATPKNPEGLTIRVFSNTEVYPSVELVEKYNLEYGSENAQGFDIIPSWEWCQFPKVDSEGNEFSNMLFISAVSKDLPKVDLFGSTKKEDTSVLNQGSKRPELVEKLKTVFGEDLFQNQNYVDLEINTEVVIFEGIPSYFVPKYIVKGKDFGKLSYETRTNLVVNPLQIVKE